jgi:hypothetical protein
MKALRYVHQRTALVAAFVTGFAAFMFVYFLVIAGSSSPTPQMSASTGRLHGPALANATRHRAGVIHLSMGKGCGGSKSSSNGHVVLTKSGDAVCAQGGTMYAELLAMRTPHVVIIQMLTSSTVTIPGMTRYQAEYQHLRGLGVPKKLAHKLAIQVDHNPVFKQP